MDPISLLGISQNVCWLRGFLGGGADSGILYPRRVMSRFGTECVGSESPRTDRVEVFADRHV